MDSRICQTFSASPAEPGGLLGALDEKLFKTLVDNAAEIGQEIIMMDTGWYKGVIERPYSDAEGTWNAISNPLGNWEEGEERTRFPSLRALGDYVRSQGMQFGLWFEPERVGRHSVLARKHPDWIVYATSIIHA